MLAPSDTPRRASFCLPLAAAALIFSLAASGCTTSMSYATQPQTLEPGEVQGTAMMQVSANTNIITESEEALDAARANIEQAQEQGTDLEEREFREGLDAAVAYILFRPAVVPEAALRVGIIDGLDAGIRYNGASTKIDVKKRLWQTPDGNQALSVTAGVGRQTVDVPSFVDYLTLSEFKRWDADFALMYGAQPYDFLRLYVGPRLMHSWVTVEPKLDEDLRAVIPDEYQDLEPSQYFEDENILHVGGTAGLMVGYEWIWATIEVTTMYMLFEPTVLEEKRDLSGVTLAPVAGLTFEF